MGSPFYSWSTDQYLGVAIVERSIGYTEFLRAWTEGYGSRNLRDWEYEQRYHRPQTV